MTQHLSLSKVVLLLVIIVAVIGFSAFSQDKKTGKDSFRKKQSEERSSSSFNHDFRSGKAVDLKNLDEAMKQLDKEMKHLDEEMKNMDFSELNRLNESLAKMDVDKMKTDIDKAIKSIDQETMNSTFKEELSNLDKLELKKAEKELEKVKRELQREKLNFTAPRMDGAKLKESVQQAMKDARKSMEVAKVELENTRQFINALETDGLVDKGKTKRIEVKEGYLYIDGKKQTKEVSEKYKKYYKKEDFSIGLNEGDDDKI